jgi:hypothetical protein
VEFGWDDKHADKHSAVEIKGTTRSV